MPTQEQIRTVLEKYRNIAVFGLSHDRGKTSYLISEYLARKGYTIIPVNPGEETILKRKAYPDLASIPARVDVVQVYRHSEEALEPVGQAVARRKARGDVYVVWLQQGIRNEEARRMAEENDLFFVQDRCLYHEYRMLYPMEE